MILTRSAGAEEELAADTADAVALAAVEEELAVDTANAVALAGRLFAGPSLADTAAGRLRMPAAGGSYEDALASRFLIAAAAAYCSNQLLQTCMPTNTGLRRLPSVALRTSFF